MANKTLDKMNWPLMLITLGVSWEWFKGGGGELSEGEFVDGLAKTLGFFASKNPNLWVKDFLVTVSIPNSFLAIVIIVSRVIPIKISSDIAGVINFPSLTINKFSADPSTM